VLPYGTPEEVREQVRERLSVLGVGGGYVFAPTQDLQADVPPENMVAMYNAVREYGATPWGISEVVQPNVPPENFVAMWETLQEYR
jgi:hypothetical protein